LFAAGRIAILGFLINLPVTAMFLQVMGVSDAASPAPWTKFYLPHCAVIFYAIGTYQPDLYKEKLWAQLTFVNLCALPVSLLYALVIYGLYLAGRKVLRADR